MDERLNKIQRRRGWLELFNVTELASPAKVCSFRYFSFTVLHDDGDDFFLWEKDVWADISASPRGKHMLRTME